MNSVGRIFETPLPLSASKSKPSTKLCSTTEIKFKTLKAAAQHGTGRVTIHVDPSNLTTKFSTARGQ